MRQNTEVSMPWRNSKPRLQLSIEVQNCARVIPTADTCSFVQEVRINRLPKQQFCSVHSEVLIKKINLLYEYLITLASSSYVFTSHGSSEEPVKFIKQSHSPLCFILVLCSHPSVNGWLL
jgi:hypothetical protein